MPSPVIPSNETSLLAHRKFKVHAQEFQFQGSASLAKNEQRIYITDKGAERTLQLIVQLVEAHPSSPGGQRPIDGVAPPGDLLVALLEPKRFYHLLEELYHARRDGSTVVISLESDHSGRIARLEHRAFLASEVPRGGEPPASDCGKSGAA